MKQENYCQVVVMTREEQKQMYMEMDKEHIIELLLNCQELLENLAPKGYNKLKEEK